MRAAPQDMLRRDLYRLKEHNMRVSSKLTRLEAQAYSSRDKKGRK
jgi:hypothetical protein